MPLGCLIRGYIKCLSFVLFFTTNDKIFNFVNGVCGGKFTQIQDYNAGLTISKYPGSDIE